MAPNQLNEFLEGRKCRAFKSHPFYSKEGDFITYYFEGDECYASRLDDFLTAYFSVESKRFVGFKLKGVRRLRETLGDYMFTVFDGKGKLKLGMLFMAGAYLCANADTLEHYRRLGGETKHVDVENVEDVEDEQLVCV